MVLVLRKHWKLTAVAVFSLSIAIALGVVSLSVSNTFLWLPPSAPEPDRLITIYTRADTKAVDQVSYPDFKYYREHNHVFTDIAGAPNSISLLADWNLKKQEIKIFARPVSENYLAVLGIRPFLGRLFLPGDDERGAQVAVMTYTCWKRLGADPKIVGKAIGTYTIVGVTPKEFTGSFYGLNGDLLTLLDRESYDPTWFVQRDARRLFLIARLKPGVSKRAAQAEMAALAGQLAAAYPKEDKNRTAVVARATLLSPDVVPSMELIAGVLLAIVLLVLLIACANVANLLLAVAVGRRQEASIKLALGAPRGRLIREFLKESAMLCGASGALGWLMAAVAIGRYSDFTFDFPIWGEFSFGFNLRLDATVAAFTVALMLIAILVTGLAPALYASSPNLAEVLRSEIVVGGTRRRVRRNALVIVQVAISTLVLIGMGLCQRSLYNLRHVDPGFSERKLLATEMALSRNGYSEARGKQVYETLRQRARAVAGVESVSLTTFLPLLGAGPEALYLPDGQKITVVQGVVDADYFATFGIRVLAGRVFTSIDREGSQEAVVINRKLADLLWPGKDPTGRNVMVGTPARKAMVVGMVADGKYEDLDEPQRPFVYFALSQHYRDALYLVARTAGDPGAWIEPLAQVQRGLGLPVPMPPFTLDNWMNLTILVQRITATCVAALSGLGLLLAIIGLFGAISYSVSERKKELGIRVALGAQSWQLLGMVLRQTLSVAGAGVALGVMLGVGATVLLRSQFYAVSAVEWTVLVPVGVGMVGVSAIVAYLSARPWISVDPMEAVRHV
jgi:predicted permease